jgi:uncharacterized protein YpuA (DUF1002 family)
MPVPVEKTTVERLARIEVQLEGIKKDQAEMRAWLTAVLAEMRTATGLVQSQSNSRDNFCAARSSDYTHLDGQVKDHEERLDAIEKLMPALKVVTWIGAALGVSIMALIWSMITGQVTVMFP